jgi:hypothetical protein
VFFKTYQRSGAAHNAMLGWIGKFCPYIENSRFLLICMGFGNPDKQVDAFMA